MRRREKGSVSSSLCLVVEGKTSPSHENVDGGVVWNEEGANAKFAKGTLRLVVVEFDITL